MNATIYAKFVESVTRNPDRVAMKYRKGGQYVPITYAELRQKVDAVAASLRKLGISKGDTLVIASYNRPEWAIADLAAQKVGAIAIPVYHMPGHIMPTSFFKYIMNDARVQLIFVEDRMTYDVVMQVKTEVPSLRHIIMIEPAQANGLECLKFDDLLKVEASAVEPPTGVSPDDIATIVYTSGTTGEPKGVMLSHNNIVSNAVSSLKKCRFTRDDVMISYLPLGHMFERTCGQYAVLFEGGCIGYAADLLTVAKDAEEIRPTMIVVVPRILEKAYSLAVERVEGSSPFKRGLVLRAVKALNERANRTYKKMKISPWLKLKCAVYDALVASKFRKLGGGRIRLVVSGAAPLNRQLAKIVYIMGINIVEGYGLTEASPVVACSSVEDNVLGTVGKPIDGVEVKIGPKSEVLVRGPNVMKGYLNRAEATSEAIDSAGWLHTGDQGKFDERGNLVLTGRIKEIIVTASGKNITPTVVEGMMIQSRYIEQAMVYGDNRKYLIALVVPCRDVIEQYAREHNIGRDGYAQLMENDKVKELIKSEVRRATDGLASYEQVKAFALLAEPFSVANEMLTPSQKIRRKKVIEKYASLIEKMYIEAEISAEKGVVCHL